MAGGKIAAFKLEHVWGEAFIDYVPSRGAKHHQGDTWVPLDASFKLYDYTSPLNIPAIAGFDSAGDLAQLLQSASLDEANASVTGVDAEFLKSRLSAYQATLAEYSRRQPHPLTLDQAFGAKTIRASNLPTLSGALPYATIAIGSRFAALPDQLRHTVTLEFFATALDRSLAAPALTQTFSLPRLQLQRLGITYVPFAPPNHKGQNVFGGGVAGVPQPTWVHLASSIAPPSVRLNSSGKSNEGRTSTVISSEPM
ncbi:hypothetical protein [Methylocaldum szegediense]|uniref:Uncharacterized protein n=1 Tax=Methylocaldum szegediense TaxID=73780 RepID=A0ABM9I6Z0_9GAMM|nr:hypothetical protein [Methylocaldum szegediense]CAI8929983.1 protein of unknown function [Methylocaldum szegediense]